MARHLAHLIVLVVVVVVASGGVVSAREHHDQCKQSLAFARATAAAEAHLRLGNATAARVVLSRSAFHFDTYNIDEGNAARGLNRYTPACHMNLAQLWCRVHSQQGAVLYAILTRQLFIDWTSQKEAGEGEVLSTAHCDFLAQADRCYARVNGLGAVDDNVVSTVRFFLKYRCDAGFTVLSHFPPYSSFVKSSSITGVNLQLDLSEKESYGEKLSRLHIILGNMREAIVRSGRTPAEYSSLYTRVLLQFCDAQLKVGMCSSAKKGAAQCAQLASKYGDVGQTAQCMAMLVMALRCIQDVGSSAAEFSWQNQLQEHHNLVDLAANYQRAINIDSELLAILLTQWDVDRFMKKSVVDNEGRIFQGSEDMERTAQDLLACAAAMGNVRVQRRLEVSINEWRARQGSETGIGKLRDIREQYDITLVERLWGAMALVRFYSEDKQYHAKELPEAVQLAAQIVSMLLRSARGSAVSEKIRMLALENIQEIREHAWELIHVASFCQSYAYKCNSAITAVQTYLTLRSSTQRVLTDRDEKMEDPHGKTL